MSEHPPYRGGFGRINPAFIQMSELPQFGHFGHSDNRITNTL